MNTPALLSLMLALSSSIGNVSGQSAQCNTVLSMWKKMGKTTTSTNGCTLSGVTSSSGVVTAIDWSFKMLTGPIPPEIGTLTSLKSLDLAWNQLTGALPKEIGKLTNLVKLNVPLNFLNGTLPVEIGNLTKLTWLYLGYNNFVGAIPKEIGKLTSLNKLLLMDCYFSGSVPTEIGNLVNLKEFYIEKNQITGLPASLGALTGAVKVVFPNPKLTSIPSSVFAQNPAAVLSQTNWTNLMTIPVLKKRQSTSSLNSNELYALCPLNKVQETGIVAGCVAGIYNKLCKGVADLTNCQIAYDSVVSASFFKSLGVCAAWKSGPKSLACSSAISSFKLDLTYLTLTSTNARDFVTSIFASRTYAPCTAATCKWT